MFLRRFPLRGVVFLFPINNTIFTQNVREKNITARPCERTQKMHRQEAYCPLSIFYIYDMRSAVIMSQFTPSTAPLNATRPCPRKSAPDPLGRGQKRILGRNTPLLCVIVTVNTTLSGGGQPPSPRKSSGLVDDCRLRPACYAYPLVKVALSRDIDRRIVYRISNRYPLSDSGTAYSGMPSNIGTCSECRVSAAGYLPQRRKITS